MSVHEEVAPCRAVLGVKVGSTWAGPRAPSGLARLGGISHGENSLPRAPRGPFFPHFILLIKFFPNWIILGFLACWTFILFLVLFSMWVLEERGSFWY